MRPLYLFDLDGTLADATHRLHFIQGPGKKDWPAFFEACDRDAPIHEMLDLLNVLSTHTMHPAEIWIVSGRSDAVRDKTNWWLIKHLGWTPNLIMRKAGDYRPDDEVKEEWLHSWSVDNRRRIRMVFDDRRRVVDMWRRNGLRCCHIAEGEF